MASENIQSLPRTLPKETVNHDERLPLLPGAKLGIATGDNQQVDFDYRLQSGRISRSESNWRAHCREQKKKGKPILVDRCDLWKEKEDIVAYFRKAKELHVEEVRFSIDPTRLIGTSGEIVNVIGTGVEFFREILDSAYQEGVGVNIAFYHRSMPSDLDWTDKKTVDYFPTVVDVFLQEFGRHPAISGYTTAVELTNELLAGYASGKLPPYKTALNPQNARSAYDNMVLYHRKAVDKIYAYYHGKPPPVFLSHNWIPIAPKNNSAFWVNKRLVRRFYQSWNENLKGFLDERVILAVNAYDHIEGLSALDRNSIPFLGYRFPYSDGVARPDAARVALEEARKFLDENGFAGVHLAVGEIGLGLPGELKGEEKAAMDRRQAEYFKQAFIELARLQFDIAGIGIWTLTHNGEWTFGHDYPYLLSPESCGVVSEVYEKRAVPVRFVSSLTQTIPL